ncbi:FBD-associated F-box protein At1g66310-like [Bidens hawaiensis]|uniref:FBD-associated F-box protein At1g66310-like n=1 Tax=Bidens hawaiensis TaxID=980011 RepID=UPI00404A750A
MEDVSSLVKASVSFDGVRSCHLWVELLKGLNGVKSLSVRNPSSLVNFKTAFSSPRHIFPNLKHLELNGLWVSRQIPQFLESCPKLKHLCIARVSESFPKEPEEYNLVPACMLTNLTSIEISKCKGRKPETKFLEYILGNAEVLKSITIIWENLKHLKCEEFVKTLPRASKCCEIHFNGRVGYTSS